MNKKIIILAAAWLATAGLFAQNNKKPQVPEAVQSAFAKQFPKAEEVKWELEEQGVWEAEFEVEEADMSANFKDTGEWLETETELSKDALPAAVRTAFQKHYPDKRMREAARIERPGGQVFYEVEIRVNGKEQDVLFTPEGNPAK